MFEARLKVGFTPDAKLWSVIVLQVFPPNTSHDLHGAVLKLQNGFAASFTVLPLADLQSLATLILEALPAIQISLDKQSLILQKLKELEAKAFELSSSLNPVP